MAHFGLRELGPTAALKTLEGNEKYRGHGSKFPVPAKISSQSGEDLSRIHDIDVEISEA